MIKSFVSEAVDMVQNGKKQFVTTFVKHEGLADTMIKFIDTQAKYTKSTADAFIDSALGFGQLVADKNFSKDLVEAYGLDKFVPATQAASKKAK
jgi:hypothetical protein